MKVDSLEASEVVKLLNNSFRDVSFGYANQVGQLCEALNVDTVAVINAANEGYLRNPLPLPSPGVGGTCLQQLVPGRQDRERRRIAQSGDASAGIARDTGGRPDTRPRRFGSGC